MDDQNNPTPLPKEPGRRYSASRTSPGPGTDVRPGSTTKVATPQVATTLSATMKDITAAKKPNPTGRKPATTKPALPRTAKSIVLRRQMIEHAKEHKHKIRRNYGKHIISVVIVSVIVLSLGTILWAFRDLLPDRPGFMKQKTTNSVIDERLSFENTELDETSPTPAEIATYVMSETAPRVLRIPKIELEARVRRVGMSLSGEPIGPSNVFDVGWFEVNGKPRDPGAVLLNGHSAGPTKAGIFSRLHELQPGDSIIIELGDKSIVTYVVTKVQQYPVNQLDMTAATKTINPSKNGLNLITTNSKYSSRSNTPYKQVIVFTVQQ